MSTAIPLTTGRRMTAIARRYQKPSSPREGRRRSAQRSRFEPSAAITAGRTTTAATAASATTAMPAYAKDRMKTVGKISSAAREAATVTALKATVRPAVTTIRTTASSCARPPARSSR